MPLRDHFRPPLSRKSSWEGLHGQLPARIVLELRDKLPRGFIAEPRVHLGSQIEIDVATFEPDEPTTFHGNQGGVATALWAPAKPNVSLETELPDLDEYEVHIYDVTRERTLVAAIELVSPANKDRPEHRAIFIAKCAALLKRGIAVSIVDLVTVRSSNLYVELLKLIGRIDPTMGDDPPATYAASTRWVKRANRHFLDSWSHILNIGQTLPTIPLWLNEDLAIPLDLESAYEKACHDLWIE